jgi:hypothetical protein
METGDSDYREIILAPRKQSNNSELENKKNNWWVTEKD